MSLIVSIEDCLEVIIVQLPVLLVYFKAEYHPSQIDGS